MKGSSWEYALGAVAVLGILAAGYVYAAHIGVGSITYSNGILGKTDEEKSDTEATTTTPAPVWPAVLDTKEYDERLLALAGYVPPKPIIVTSTTTDETGAVVTVHTTTTPPSPLRYASTTNVTVKGSLWPTAAPYPNGDAILPFKRIVAYYGNFYSRQMGILGELEPTDMLAHLAEKVADWEKEDPTTPVLPAIEYIAIVAQGSAGADGMYRAVMPDKEIDKAYELAKEIHGVLILDIQVGLSPLSAELPKFKKYLERPDVFLAIDPEFSMKGGQRPGTVIGTFDATDVNYAIDYLSTIVRDNELPPKVLIVHRFTEDMVTGSPRITPTPEVQVVVNMDGWGPKDLKRGTYGQVIAPEPVQFTGVKLFYKNDLKTPSTGLLTPAEVMALHPKPIYIQYQ